MSSSDRTLPAPQRIVVPVEKKGKYAESYTSRFACFDPSTRMLYLSDKGSNIQSWKHRMKLYAIEPRYTGRHPLNIRHIDFEGTQLLNFTVHGVTHHRLTEDAASRVELSQLPNLKTFVYREPKHGYGAYVEGTNTQKRSEEPMSLSEDAAFFDKDRIFWVLRTPTYGACHDLLMSMRDTLIADGLHVPVHGGFPNCCDPRYGLQFAHVPLWVQKPFAALLGAVVFTCVHGAMVGCSPAGELGICMRHCYVCVTDRDVLFLSEAGEVVRWIPVNRLERFQYKPASSDRTEKLFCAFLAEAGGADVLFMPTDAFALPDASESMVSMMPKCDAAAEVMKLKEVIERLASVGPASPLLPSTGAAANEDAKAREGAEDYDSDLDGLDDLDDLVQEEIKNSASQPAAAHGSAGPATVTAVTTDSAICEAIAPMTTLTTYTQNFLARVGRTIKWQTQPGYKLTPPTVESAQLAAKKLGMVPPQRQEITFREEFQPLYFSGTAAFQKTETEQVSARAQATRETSSRVDEIYGEELFVPSVPVRKASGLKILKPFRDYTETMKGRI